MNASTRTCSDAVNMPRLVACLELAQLRGKIQVLLYERTWYKVQSGAAYASSVGRST